MTPANHIHPTAIVGPDVEMGSGNIVMPYAILLGPTRVGDDNWIGPHSTIGTPAQHRDSAHPRWDERQGEFGIEIGSRNRIREYVSIHQGFVRPTRLHDDCYLMAYAHVPHDAEYGDGVTMANSTQVGGHTVVGRGANIGLGVDIHQRTVIGAFAVIGMNATVTRDIPPYALAKGSPARVTGANRIGMHRQGIPDEIISRLNAHYANGNLDAPSWIEPPLLDEFVRFEQRQQSASARKQH
jgi:UDP-N-acetylglucosamine acyltransferase